MDAVVLMQRVSRGLGDDRGGRTLEDVLEGVVASCSRAFFFKACVLSRTQYRSSAKGRRETGSRLSHSSRCALPYTVLPVVLMPRDR